MDQFNIDGYTCRRVLGEGATGNVYLATKDGRDYAVKLLEKNDGSPTYARLKKNMQVEIEALSAAGDHPHIMKIVGSGFGASYNQSGTQKQADYIVTEVEPNGELFDYVDNPMGAISEDVAKQLLLQMVSGLSHMNQCGLVNRDIKLENMLVDQAFNIRIADFGFAQVLEGKDQDGQITTFLGTPGYMAPEILENRAYNGTAVDTYALGVVLFAMVTKSTPFSAMGRLGANQSVIQSDRLFQLFTLDKATYYSRYQMPLSDEFKSLIDAMLNPNPLLRPSTADIVMHPWVVNQGVTADEARADMHARKEAKEGKPVPMPSLVNRRAARQAVRGGPQRGGKTYCVGPLTEEQKAEGVIALSLNTHVQGQNIPGSKYVTAQIAAPDLFDWLQSVITSREVIDNLTVDDNVWKITYSIQRTIDPPEMEEELRELFDEDEEQTIATAKITAEIMQIQGLENEGTNVIEFRRKDGSPQIYNDHVSWLVNYMQQDREEEQKAQ